MVGQWGSDLPAHFKDSGMLENALSFLVENAEWNSGTWSQARRKAQAIPSALERVFSGKRGGYLACRG